MHLQSFMVRSLAIVWLLAAAQPAFAQDALVCQLAGKQAKCPGNATLTAGTLSSSALPAAGTAGTYANPVSITTDAKGRVTSVSVASFSALVFGLMTQNACSKRFTPMVKP